MLTTPEKLNPRAPAFTYTPTSSPLASPLPQYDSATRKQHRALVLALTTINDPHSHLQDQDQHLQILPPLQEQDDWSFPSCPSVPPPRLSPSERSTFNFNPSLQHLDEVDSRIALITGYPPATPMPSVPSLTFSDADEDEDSNSVSSELSSLSCKDCMSHCDVIGHAPFLWFAPEEPGLQVKVSQDDAVSCLGLALMGAMTLDS